MKKVLVIAAIVVVAFLAFRGCFGGWTTSWNQRLTLVIETPQGEVRGAAVTRVTNTETSGSLVLPEARGVQSKVEGEAVVVEVAPGKFLFALLSGSGDEMRDATHWVYPAYHLGSAVGVDSRPSYGAAMMKLRAQPHDTPVPLPPGGWPMLVTFYDISRPETVRRVDPADLAAVFGEGVRLKAMTLEITEEAVTEGRVDRVLGWMGPYPEPHLIPGDGRSSDIPFGMTVSQGDFIRRP